MKTTTEVTSTSAKATSILTGDSIVVIDPLSEARAIKAARNELAMLRAQWSTRRTVRAIAPLFV